MYIDLFRLHSKVPLLVITVIHYIPSSRYSLLSSTLLYSNPFYLHLYLYLYLHYINLFSLPLLPIYTILLLPFDFSYSFIHLSVYISLSTSRSPIAVSLSRSLSLSTSPPGKSIQARNLLVAPINFSLPHHASRLSPPTPIYLLSSHTKYSALFLPPVVKLYHQI